MARTMPYDLSTIGRIAGYALLVYCAAEVVFTWHSFVLLNFFTTVEIGALTAAELDAEGAWIDSAGAIVGIGFIVILLACYIVSGIWLYRASANAAAVHPADGRITPGWAVGWYFVPFANLWMPFKSMRQTWNGLNGNPDMNKGMPGWTIAWWVLWLIGNYVAWFGLRLNLDAQTLDEFRLATTFDIVSSVASIPAALLFRKLILDLTRASAGATPFTPSEMPGASPEEG